MTLLLIIVLPSVSFPSTLNFLSDLPLCIIPILSINSKYNHTTNNCYKLQFFSSYSFNFLPIFFFVFFLLVIHIVNFAIERKTLFLVARYFESGSGQSWHRLRFGVLLCERRTRRVGRHSDEYYCRFGSSRDFRDLMHRIPSSGRVRQCTRPLIEL